MSEQDNDWVLRLMILLNRYPHLGAASDVALMTRAEAWGLFCFVSQLARG